ncbi:MAG TPA: aldehyde dehydrogenase family protein [Acidobacteriaceae bacterium]
MVTRARLLRAIRPELGLGLDAFLSLLLADLAVLDVAALDGALRGLDRSLDFGFDASGTFAASAPVVGLKTSPKRPLSPWTCLPPEAGISWVNCWFLRDLRTPFGGAKLSGIGREGELHSPNFYSEPMNVCIKL